MFVSQCHFLFITCFLWHASPCGPGTPLSEQAREVHDENRDSISLDDVGKFEMPTLIVRGENSNILAPDAAERFRDALPQGQLVTIPECGHNVHSQNTLGFIGAVGAFLSTLE